MKKIWLLIVFLMISLLGLSQFTSDVSGDWTTSTNWDGDVAPTLVGGNKLNDNTTIASGTIIDLTSDLEISSGTTLIINGRLNVSGNITFKNGSTVLVNVGGILHILSSGANANNSTDVTIDGQLIIDDDFEAGAGSTIEGVGEVTISGISSGDGTIFGDATGCSGCSFSGGGSLPITLAYFNAFQDGTYVDLSFLVHSQINNNYFTIEKSKDCYEWEEVVVIDGCGNCNLPMIYNFKDKSPYLGVSYYKLRQTDFNGEFEEFLPISLNILDPNRKKSLIHTLNISGQEVDPNTGGVIFNVYDNGEIEKIYNINND